MRTLVGLGVAGLVSVLPLSTSASFSATSPKPTDLPQSYLFTATGELTPLGAGTRYAASRFPLPIRVTVVEPGWSGTQWRSGHDYFRGGGPPNYGWVHLGRGSARAAPLGLVSIMTAYGATPSVAGTVTVLRTRGRGAEYGPSRPVVVAGYRGIQFDGRITGPRNSDHVGHYFIPFSPRSHAAHYYPDEYPVYGDVFRVIVVGVHGKSVVIYLENVALPPDDFPGFLTKAERLVRALRFA